MQDFEEVWTEILDFIQKYEPNIRISTEALARRIKIDPAQISRIKNGKSVITENSIEKISGYLSTLDRTFSKTIEENLRRLQLRTQESNLEDSTTTENDPVAIKPLESLLKALAKAERAALFIDYRDMPRSGSRGPVPYLAKKAGDAVSDGLYFAMFQPFGPPDALLKEHRNIQTNLAESLDPSKSVVKMPNAETFANAYWYLFGIAQAVRRVFKEIRELSGNNQDRIVLYEAHRKSIPLTAIGFQSRLFYACYTSGGFQQRKVFDWVAASQQEHFFVHRHNESVNLDVIRAQFYPISTFWEKNDRLPVGTELDDAYTASGLSETEVRWANYKD